MFKISVLALFCVCLFYAFLMLCRQNAATGFAWETYSGFNLLIIESTILMPASLTMTELTTLSK